MTYLQAISPTYLRQFKSSHPKSPASRQQILLIDLENCPSQTQFLLENLETFSKIIICYAKTATKIPLDWLSSLSESIRSGQLKLHKMQHVGKNSADFGLFFLAGSLMNEVPANSHFVIISKDGDLEYLIDLIQDRGHSAERVGTTSLSTKVDTPTRSASIVPKTAPDATSEITSEDSLEDMFEKYCKHLRNHHQHRPARRDTLLSSIANQLKPATAKKIQIFDLLLHRGVIQVGSDNRILYQDSILETLLSQAQ